MINTQNFIEIPEELYNNIIENNTNKAKLDKDYGLNMSTRSTCEEEITILKTLGFPYYHKKSSERCDGMLCNRLKIFAECKSTSDTSKEWKFSFKAKDGFIEVCEKNAIWQLCGLWNNKTNELMCVLCGTAEQILPILRNTNRNSNTESKNCKIGLVNLLKHNFKVICVSNTPEEIYNIFVEKYPSIKNMKDELDLIPLNGDNCLDKNIFKKYHRYNKFLQIA